MRSTNPAAACAIRSLQSRPRTTWPKHHSTRQCCYTRHRSTASIHTSPSSKPRHKSTTTTHHSSKRRSKPKATPSRRERIAKLVFENVISRRPTVVVSRRAMGLPEMGRCPITLSGASCDACSAADADRHIKKRVLPDPKATPTRELNIGVNPHYPLLSTTQPPLPFVRPADVMPPSALEEGHGIAQNTNNLPVLTSGSFSAPVTLTKGTHQLPDRLVIGALVQSPAPKTPIAPGTMGPPPRPVKK